MRDFLLSVFGNELLSRCFPRWRIGPFPRTSLNDLYSLAHSEVVSVFSQLSSQTLYRYDQFCYHIFKILVFATLLLTRPFAFRSHRVRHRCVREAFLKSDANTMNILPFPNFFRNFFHFLHFFEKIQLVRMILCCART